MNAHNVRRKKSSLLPVLFSLCAGAIEGSSPHLVIPETSTGHKVTDFDQTHVSLVGTVMYQWFTVNFCRPSLIKSSTVALISQTVSPVMFIPLHYNCSLVVMVVNGRCLEADCAFIDHRRV